MAIGKEASKWDKGQSLLSVVNSFGFHECVEKYLRDYLLLKITPAPWN